MIVTFPERPRPYAHLPPDVAPGAQSRAFDVGWLEFGSVVIFDLLVLFLGLVLLTTGGPRIPGAGVVGNWVLRVLAGAVLVWLARSFYYGLRTRRANRIRIHVIADRVSRGDSVIARVTAPRGVGKLVSVGLVCEERYDFAVASERGWGKERKLATDFAYEDFVHLELERSGDIKPLTFVPPADGLFSYEGNCLSYAWRVFAIELSSSRFPAWGEQAIWVAP